MRVLTGVEEREGLAWLERAASTAGRSLCLHSKCGTVIVKEGEVIGEGYNAPPLDDVAHRRCLRKHELPQDFKSDKTCCIHAEQRAIMDALARVPEKLSGSRLYFVRLGDDGRKKSSGKPYCTHCSKLALDAGIAEFVLWHEAGLTVYDTADYNERSFAYRG